MAIKFITVFVIITVVAAIPIELDSQQNVQPDYETAPESVKTIVGSTTFTQPQEYDQAQYKFNYAVNDKHTGDIKTQEETRNGDHVVGRYTLIDADGYQRIVEYTADDHNGFQAIVHREPIQDYKTPIVSVQQYEKVAKDIAPASNPIGAIDSYNNHSDNTNTEADEYQYQH